MAEAVRVFEVLLPSQMEGEPPVAVQFTAAVEVTSPVVLDQLAAELADLVDLTEVPLMSNGDPAQAAEGGPVHLWTEAAISGDSLLAAAQAHQPDADWVRGEPEFAVGYEAVTAKARQRRMLTPDEMQVALWHLLAAEEAP